MTQDLSQRLHAMILFIDNASAKAEEDVIVDLDHLERDILALQADIKLADSNSAQALQPLMVRIISKLEELALSLEAHKLRVQAQDKA